MDRLRVFISRAGQDAAVAAEVARVLEDAGIVVLSQDANFGNANFMLKMHDSLRQADRVAALLSESYLKSDYCLAEWANALAEDPLNRRGRLVVLRIDDCLPTGILSGIPYHEIGGLLDDADAFRQALLRVLVSPPDALHEGFDQVAVGPQRFEGQDGSGRFHQLPSGGPASTSRLETQHKTNIGARPTSFVGRRSEVADLGELLGSDRMVTLFGFGGVGKTRVALEVGTSLLGSYSDGVWLVQFAPLSNPELIVDTVTAALGIRSDSSKFSLSAALRSRRLLLIFDNCEHLAVPIGVVLTQLLAECPGVAILATSRQPLGVIGETLFRIEPLRSPPKSLTFGVEEAVAYESVELFSQRARSVDRHFVLDRENVAAVAAICSRLEGIPLAIELAAARVNILQADDLLARLGDRFKLLKRTSADSEARHQTLRATIDWSFDLLEAREKELFGRLAVFAGGWSLEAAEYVCADEAKGLDVLEGLSSLVDKSLVTFDSTTNRSRYAFLETTRAYALEKLAASDDEAAMASRRAEWFARFTDEIYEQFSAAPHPGWLARVLPEIENLRASLHWALDVVGDLEVAGRIAGGLGPLWQARGVGEGRRYVETALARWPNDGSPRIKALLWLTLAGMTVAKRKLDAAESAHRLYLELSDLVGQAESFRYRAEGLRQMQRLDEANIALDQGLALFNKLGLIERPSYSALLQTRALLLANAGRYAESVSAFGEALRRLQGNEDDLAIAGVKCQLADVEFWVGNVEPALKLLGEAVEICERLGDTVKQAGTSLNVAAYHLLAGDIEAARLAARNALELAVTLDVSFYATLALQHLGTVAALQGDAARGRLLLSYTDRWLASEGFQREITEQRTYDLGIDALRQEAQELLPVQADITEQEALAAARQI